MKTIVFVQSISDFNPDEHYIDIRSANNVNYSSDSGERKLIELSVIYEQYGKKWLEEFSALLASLNKDNASLLWWAYTSTAKNLLSSPLGEYYVQVRAICEIFRQKNINTLNVIGATPGQMESIASYLSSSEIRFCGQAWKLKKWSRHVSIFTTLARQPIFFARIVFGFFLNRRPEIDKNIDVCLFTYLDGELKNGEDNYFGKLPQLLKKNKSVGSVLYLAYVYHPYRKRIRQISGMKSVVPYVALFGLLSVSDCFWVLSKVCVNWWENSFSTKKNIRGNVKEFSPLLHEAFLHDIAVGGYLHNLLIYKSISQFIRLCKPRVLMYPFENKSLEKMIILGVNNFHQKPELVGFQHSSITPRHITLLFRQGEVKYTPLPDKIITVGSVTKKYLEEFGNYPLGIFYTGCALRQNFVRPHLERGSRGNVTRVLLVLSSSENELIQAVRYFKKVLKIKPKLELGIRPHINFPLTLLPNELANWVVNNTLDFSETLLEDNLYWCNVTTYVSSTAALEALMQGKPIINFSIGDIISPDPVIGKAPFHWYASNESDMVDIIDRLQKLSDDEYADSGVRAIKYAKNYLVPVDETCIKKFLIS